MLQWFLRFAEFTEFNESSGPFRETPMSFEYIEENLTHFLRCCCITGDCNSINTIKNKFKNVKQMNYPTLNETAINCRLEALHSVNDP